MAVVESGDWLMRARMSEGEIDVGDESGDWFTLGVERGVEKAPVDCRWRRSKISCSSFGRRGGDGPPKGEGVFCWRMDVVKARRDSRRGRRRARCMIGKFNEGW